jgi:hypothetical protein
MKLTHTHRGHCQICGAVQALATDSSRVAKHGYTVEGGMFEGVCPGSDHVNLHVERTLTDLYITRARTEAVESRELAARYDARTAHPSYVWGGQMKLIRKITRKEHRSDWPDNAPCSPLMEVGVDVKWAEASPEYQEKGRAVAAAALRRRAETCTAYALNLEKMADSITGKVEPFLVSDLRLLGWKVGDTVRIGGKKGYDATIEAIEERPYQSRGWTHRTTKKIPQAQLTRPAIPATYWDDGGLRYPAQPATTYWEPLRLLRKPKESK